MDGQQRPRDIGSRSAGAHPKPRKRSNLDPVMRLTYPQPVKHPQGSAAQPVLDTCVAELLATDNSASVVYASEFIHLIIKFS